MCLVEQRIQIGQQSVALSDGFSDEVGVLLLTQPGFSPLGVHGGMATEERLVGPSLVPAN